MKKKLLNSLRVLLVAAGLGVGGSTWAEDTPVTLQCANSVTLVGAKDYAANETYCSTTICLNSYAGQGGAGAVAFTLDNDWDVSKVKSATLQIYPISKCDKSRSGDIYIRGLASYPSSPSDTYKSYSDDKHIVYSYGSTDKTKRYTFSGTAVATVSARGENNSVPAINAYYDIDVTSYIQGLTSKSAGDAVYFGIDISDWAAGIQLGAYGNTYAPKLVITYTDETLYTASFTETNSLTPTVTIYSDAEMTSEVNNGTLIDGTTYYYKAVLTGYRDVTGSFTVASANPSISFTMTAKETYTYHLYYKLGTADAVEQATATLYEDETATLYYPVCRKDGDNYYVVSKNASAPYFGAVMSYTNQNVTVNYTLDESIVYYAESENMSGSRYNYAHGENYSSNGASYCSAASTNSYIATNWDAAAGKYNIEVGMANRNYSVNPAPKLMTSSEDANPVTLDAISLSSSSYTQKTYYNQPITAGQNLFIFNDNGGNASKWALDYVILRTPATVSATIGSYGYASFSSTSALDFTDVTDAMAYIATSKSGDNIVLTSVTGKVAAGTGLVLKSANGSSASVNIPVTDSGTTYNTESATKNYLFAISSNYTLNTSKTGTNYVLTVQNEKVVFAPIGATGAAVTAGQAALWIPTAGTGARALDLVFDDEAAGISSIKNEELLSKSIFNLNGQRISQPVKGLYIVNGKKVIIK